MPAINSFLPMNQEESYIHGMLAFPLLELGRMEEDAAASRKGYEINKKRCLGTSLCVMFLNMNVSLKKQWSSWKNSQNLGTLAHHSCKAFP
ncbi:hypothetical protein F2Q70_00020612 [Brassica cretica]|uniref:Uncharacterized protein n=1 Tax=Brassica cretica TaxID=69181 RepID=A0A8S9GVC8_BRACR|nr:hypothetical protein F2Q70_00020612 [Brassica cretica]